MEILEELKQYKYKLDNVAAMQTNLLQRISLLDKDIDDCDRNLKGVIESRQYSKKAIDLIYEK